MKLPLSFRATLRMKEFYDFKAEVYIAAAGTFPRGASVQGDQPRGYQGDSPGVEHDPQAERGVPDDGPASEDENYSSGKGKDKKIKSESKVTKSSNKDAASFRG